jgi:hypothetical protein
MVLQHREAQNGGLGLATGRFFFLADDWKLGFPLMLERFPLSAHAGNDKHQRAALHGWLFSRGEDR